jgi:hypothetical protein
MTITVEVPPVAGVPQAQGDLSFWPWDEQVSSRRRAADIAAAQPVTGPVVLVTGSGGHDHTLMSAGMSLHTTDLRWHRYPGDSQTLGVLVVGQGLEAVVRHAEHGDNRIGPGVYAVRRQREQADEIRMVQD